jgi:hypothetical protein
MGYFANFPWIPYFFKENEDPFPMLHVLRRFKVNDLFAKYVQSWDYYRIADGDTPQSVARKVYGTEEYYWVLLVFNEIVNPINDWPKTEEQVKQYTMAKYSPNRNQKYTGSASTTLDTTTISVSDTNPIILEEGMLVKGRFTDDNTLIKDLLTSTSSTVSGITTYTKTFSTTKMTLVDGTDLFYFSTPFGGANDHAIHHYIDLEDGEWIIPTEEQKSTLSSVSNYDYEYEINEQKRMIRLPSKAAVEKIVKDSATILNEDV